MRNLLAKAGMIFILVIAILGSTEVYAIIAGQQLWVRRYNPGELDEAVDLGHDSFGNLYVTGTSWSDSVKKYDIVTVKYDSAGNKKWVRRFNNTENSEDTASAIAVAPNGNIYVTGSTLDRKAYLTIKYSKSGTLLWQRRYKPGSWEHVPNDISLDGKENVFITGGSFGLESSSSLDYVTIKYNSAGTQKWLNRYDRAGDSDMAEAIAVNGTGVYVTGTSSNKKGGISSEYNDITTVKYGLDGALRWTKHHNGPGLTADGGFDITITPKGSVFVAGFSGSGRSANFTTIKYGPDGTRKWVKYLDGFVHDADVGEAIALDRNGNVIVTGSSTRVATQDGSNNFDFATVKYSPSGVKQWVKRYNGPGNNNDRPHAIATDSSGNIYITGKSRGSSTWYDFATLKYAPSGSLKWAKRYNGPSNGGDEARALDLDGNGKVYVTGGSSGNYATVKYVQ